jgi:hypothetical protein
MAGFGVTTEEFTSKERDWETGLDYFGARYFSAAQGSSIHPTFPLQISTRRNLRLGTYMRMR